MGEVRFMISEAAKQVDVESMYYDTGKKNWDLRSDGRKWAIDIIQKMISSFSAVLRN